MFAPETILAEAHIFTALVSASALSTYSGASAVALDRCPGKPLRGLGVAADDTAWTPIYPVDTQRIGSPVQWS